MTAATPTAVYAVSSRTDHYDDEPPVAAFTTRELAEEHAEKREAQERSTSYYVKELVLLDSEPALVSWYVGQGVQRADGTVEYHGAGHSLRWDYEVPVETAQIINRPGSKRNVIVGSQTAEGARARFNAEIERLRMQETTR